MLISPLGAVLMPALTITVGHFGMAVSAYAFRAGVSGLLTAGFADRFDRKRLLLFFYVGFTLGTVLCAAAQSYQLLLIGRIVTGLFGGVIGSIVLAIVTDFFPLQLRGRVMGFIQTAFAASQVLGIPAGNFSGQSLELACLLPGDRRPVDGRWRIAVVALANGAGERASETEPVSGSPFGHLLPTDRTAALYARFFTVTTLLATGGVMLMPFTSAFTVNNLGIDITPPSHDLSRVGPVDHRHGAARRQDARRVQQAIRPVVFSGMVSRWSWW